MTSSSYEYLLLEPQKDGISILTINRPEKLNALNHALLEELDLAVEMFEKSEKSSVLIITGAGEKAFVAGADIRELRSLTRAEGEKLSARGQAIFSRIENGSKPVIAVINGYALGGGAELAMACHIRIAAEHAQIGLPEVSLGTIPGYGGTQRLTKLAGKAKALELILTGQPVDAAEALQLQLVNHVRPAGEVMELAISLAKKMMRNGPLALSSAIKAVHAAYSPNGFAKEAVLFGRLCETDDFREGTDAFLEKRKADFKGK